MVDSKINAKKYFLPVYAVFAFITPTITFLMAGYITTPLGESIDSYLPWDRVAAFYALFGLIWPLTLVVSPGFFAAVKVETKLTFFEAIATSGPLAGKALLAYSLLALAWIAPVIIFSVSLVYHKRNVALQTDEPEKFGWVDYLASFI